MKRLLLWLFVSSVAVLWGSHAVGRAAPGLGLAPLAASELTSVTGGGCISKCDDDEPEEPEPVRAIGKEWRPIRQVDGPAEQLSYSIFTEVSNVYGYKPLPWQVTASDNCRYRWVSGGVGIEKGFSVEIGTVYHCSASVRMSGTLDPGWRVKIYKGNMRQVTTVTMALYELFSDGSSEDTGVRDTGRQERLWSRYTPVTVYGN
ncbi:MAG TPA: hypothetical protein VF202_05125 [Trueperaceae bacterium]|jgi:hypothetical protein